MKTLLQIALILSASLANAQTLTTISQLVLNGDGSKFTGIVVISVPPFSSQSSAVRSRDIWLCSTNNNATNCAQTIIAGVLTVALLPNGGGSPSGTAYSVAYYPDVPPGRKPATHSEYWVVPTGGPYTIDDVRVPTAPTPGLSINPSQMSTAGYTPGQFPCVTGGLFLPCGPTVVPSFGPNIIVTGTDASGNIIASMIQGTGPKVQLATGDNPAFGNCLSYDFNGNAQDSGTSCISFAPSNANVLRSDSRGRLAIATYHNVSVTMYCGAASDSTGAAYRCISSPSITPATNDIIIFFANVANTGPCTLLADGGTPRPIKKKGGSADLAANDLLASMAVLLFFDGSVWQLLSPTAN